MFLFVNRKQFELCQALYFFLHSCKNFRKNLNAKRNLYADPVKATSAADDEHFTSASAINQRKLPYTNLSRARQRKMRTGFDIVAVDQLNHSFTCCCCCRLLDPFRGMGAWRKTMEPQKPGNSPGSGREVVKR